MFVPFIPLFLSPKTTDIDIDFVEAVPAVVVASIISRLSTLCPNIECVTLNNLPRDPVLVEAVSEMLLARNRDTLRIFEADSPLTKEAQEVVYRLPRLFGMWAVIQGPMSLPTVELPDLIQIDIEYDDDLNWLQGLRGATLGKLEAVSFRSESNRIGDFFGHSRVLHEQQPSRIHYQSSSSTLRGLGIRTIPLSFRSTSSRQSR